MMEAGVYIDEVVRKGSLSWFDLQRDIRNRQMAASRVAAPDRALKKRRAKNKAARAQRKINRKRG